MIEDGEIFPGPGEYDLIIGDNPDGPGQIVLQLLDGVLALGAHAEPITDFRDEDVGVDNGIEHILNKDNWDHNVLGQSEEEVRNVLREALEDPDEFYQVDDGPSYYIEEFTIEQGQIIVQVVVDQKSGTDYHGEEVISAYVPAGVHEAGSEYQDVYDRDAVVENIKQTLEEEEEVTKEREANEIIEEFDVEDTI